VLSHARTLPSLTSTHAFDPFSLALCHFSAKPDEAELVEFVSVWARSGELHNAASKIIAIKIAMRGFGRGN